MAEATMNVLISSPVHALLPKGLEELGCNVTYAPDISPAKAASEIDLYDGIIINTKMKMDRPLIMSSKRLKFIGRLGSGLDIIDLTAAAERGIYVFRTAGANANAVAEHALGMLLSLKHKLVEADQATRALSWVRESYRGSELTGSSVGIVGFGHTGTRFAEKLKSFKVRIFAYDPYVNIKETGIAQVGELKSLCELCDVISFHVPLTPETIYMADKEFFNSCQKRPVIINTSRGKVLNLKDLTHALNKQLVSGAALDVFENEHPETYSADEKAFYSNLFERKNVIASPHVAGWTKESFENIARAVLKEVKALISNA